MAVSSAGSSVPFSSLARREELPRVLRAALWLLRRVVASQGMEENKTKIQTLCFTVIAAALAACSDAPPDDGLTLEVSTPTRIAGHFDKDGARLAFDFSKQGDTHVGEYRAADGTHLISSTLTEGDERLVIRDGALVIDGPVGSPTPTIEGDPMLLEELDGSRELALVSSLRDALASHPEIREDLYSPPKPEAARNLRRLLE